MYSETTESKKFGRDECIKSVFLFLFNYAIFLAFIAFFIFFNTVYGADGAAAGSAPGFFAASWRKRYPGLPAVEAEALHDETCLRRFLAALQIEK